MTFCHYYPVYFVIFFTYQGSHFCPRREEGCTQSKFQGKCSGRPSLKISASDQVADWLCALPPQTKRRVRAALQALAKGKGDIKGLQRSLEGFNHLRESLAWSVRVIRIRVGKEAHASSPTQIPCIMCPDWINRQRSQRVQRGNFGVMGRFRLRGQRGLGMRRGCSMCPH